MQLKIGDKVTILDEDGEGVVVALLPNQMYSIELDDFPFDFHITQLIQVNDANELTHKANERSFDHLLTDKVYKKEQEVLMHIPVNVFDKVSRMGSPEIDLHIHELVDKPKTLNNTEMIEIQVHRLERFIQSCIDQSVSKFVIIHGVGQGVLRTEIRKVLESHGNIEYRDADFREYGAGATQAIIKGLFQ